MRTTKGTHSSNAVFYSDHIGAFNAFKSDPEVKSNLAESNLELTDLLPQQEPIVYTEHEQRVDYFAAFLAFRKDSEDVPGKCSDFYCIAVIGALYE